MITRDEFDEMWETILDVLDGQTSLKGDLTELVQELADILKRALKEDRCQTL